MATYDPVYLTVGDHPRDILSLMDRLLIERDELAQRHKRWRWLPLMLFLLSFPFCLLDFFLGYSTVVFILVGLFLGITSIVFFFVLRRNRPGKNSFPPHYQTIQTVIHNLRDDVPKDGLFLGHLDLTGSQKPEKLLRTGSNARGQAMEFYQDEWFKLKAKLYDGNMLRMSLIERTKVRKGYFKRSRSGKQKWKSAKTKNQQEIKVRVAVNSETYMIVPTSEARPGTRVGPYTIETINTSDGMVTLGASALAGTIQPGDVLGILRLAYNQLQRRRDPHE